MSDWWSADPVATVPLPPRNPLSGLDPEFRSKFADLRSAAAERGVEFNAGEGLRPQERQNALYAQGRTAPGPIVTQTLNSNHTSGRANDVVPMNTDARTVGNTVQAIIQEDPRFAGMRSGASFKGLYDPLHVELNNPGQTQTAERPHPLLGAKSGATDFSASQRPQGDWWADDPVAQPQQPSQVEQRFGGMQPPQNAGPLQSGLERQAAAMTTGPEQPQVAQMATEQRNLLSGAQQGTTPHADQYKGKLVSTETFESDAGDVMYKDPATGHVVQTDKSKQVALRDPKDGVIKVYDRSADTNEMGVTGAARVLAPGLAAGAATARPAIPVASKEVVPKASDIFSTAKTPYRKFDEIADKIELPRQTASGFVERIEGAMRSAKVPKHLADEVYQSVGEIANGQGSTLAHLRDVKELIGQSFKSNDGRVKQGAAVASREINKIISEISPEAGAALKQADAIHSTAKSVQEIQNKGNIAELRAGRAGYGGNAVNSMRQVLSPIVENAIKGKTTGFKPNEIQAMRDIVEGTTATNTLRGIGQLSPSKGIMQTGGAAGATAFLGPAALAIPAMGAASNKLATILTGKQIDKLKEMVAKRSPAYAEAVGKATEKYERAQMELVNKPSPNKFAAYLSASRALSSGLQRDGVQISVGDLLRQIQGPMKSAAEDEQPKPAWEFNQ